MTTPAQLAFVRPLAAIDAAAMLRLVETNAKRFSAGGLAMLPTAPDAFDTWISAQGRGPAASFKVVYGLWIDHGDQDALVGFVGIETLHRFSGAGVWYGVDKSIQGRGLAKTGVLLAMADFSSRAFESGLASAGRWILHVHKSNERSAALGASLGFQRDELLDYTRQTSTRGGQRFLGFFNDRSASSIAAEANSRQMASAMMAQIDKEGPLRPILNSARKRLSA
ncbi:RimJ/RimL family protein N-acetyltransferase [Roseateles asaccharophilus]|uniref:GNAT family N-acetyltransferase n=1 Tax=Roseateles asaccharophilus TaxID=582607 RepID=UPI00383682FE